MVEMGNNPSGKIMFDWLLAYATLRYGRYLLGVLGISLCFRLIIPCYVLFLHLLGLDCLLAGCITGRLHQTG